MQHKVILTATAASLAAISALNAQLTVVDSIANGKWEASSTWSGGNVPGVNTSPGAARINHDVTYDATSGTIDMGDVPGGSPGFNLNIVVGNGPAAGSLSVSGGSLSGDDVLAVGNTSDGSLAVSGGSVDFRNLGLGNANRPTNTSDVTVSGGSATFENLVFEHDNASLEYSGGSLTLTNNFNGIAGRDDGTAGKSGSLTLSNIGGANFNPIQVDGELIAGGLQLDMTIAASALSTLTLGDQFVLFDYATRSTASTEAAQFTEDGLTAFIGDDSTITVSGKLFTFDYDTDLGGGDLGVTLTAIPEPGSAGLVIGAVSLAALIGRRRRR